MFIIEVIIAFILCFFVLMAYSSYSERKGGTVKTKDYIKGKILGDTIEDRKKKSAQEREFRKVHPHYEAEQFYNLCRSKGITNIKSVAEKERFKIFLSNQGYRNNINEMIDLFNLGKSEVERFEKEKKKIKENERINKLRKEEHFLIQETIRYISCIGREKGIQMCSDEIRRCKAELEELKKKEQSIRDGAEKTYRYTKQSESDWALLGGIADGIAGGAAGVATAIDAQNRNDEIRSYNANLSRSIGELTANSLSKVYELKREIEEELHEWENRLGKAKMKLVDGINENYWVDKISYEVRSVKKTELHSIKLELSLKPETLLIFDDVKAVLDGTVKVVLSKNGNRLGEGYIFFPYHGLKYPQTFKTICPNVKEMHDTYDITLEPYHLWALEV